MVVVVVVLCITMQSAFVKWCCYLQNAGHICTKLYIFTARCYASMVLAMGLCLSVSVHLCLSQVGVLLKRLNRGSHKQYHTIAQGL